MMSDPTTAQATVAHHHSPPPQYSQPAIPEWDENAQNVDTIGKAEAGNKTAIQSAGMSSQGLKDKFNRMFPAQKTYLGLRRRTFLIALACAALAIIGLVVGLAVGLTRHHGAR